MLTHIRIKNFKSLSDINFELGAAVVLIGPNNSGKTTALQALALWHLGLTQWLARRGSKPSPGKRPGVTINRNDLISLPVRAVNLLWRDLRVRNVRRVAGKQQTANIRIDIIVDGIGDDGVSWTCGLEFDFANEESFYCRPLRLLDDNGGQRMLVPEQAGSVRVAFLPPLSGLAATEPKLEAGRINVLLGEGQTAQVLRNLCYQLYTQPAPDASWAALVDHIITLFGVTLLPPRYIPERGEITMSYREADEVELDISSSGRGLQQTLLLLAYLYANPRTVLLLDEPDAHLELLRQRQLYKLLTDTARAAGSQVIAASHSEVVLNEAADRDIVIAFVGQPHRMDDRGVQVLKSLKAIGFEQYYQAEQTGWVLYLEGSTDLAILQALAATLGHPAMDWLARPFVHYVLNQPARARDHFAGLQEAKPDLVGIAIYDRLDKQFQGYPQLTELMWQQRELENYLTKRPVLLQYAATIHPGPAAVAANPVAVMKSAISEIETALQTLGRPSPWSPDIKATDDFLDPLFRAFFAKLDLRNLLHKTDYHILTQWVTVADIDPEVTAKLDQIVEVAHQAKPRRN